MAEGQEDEVYETFRNSQEGSKLLEEFKTLAGLSLERLVIKHNMSPESARDFLLEIVQLQLDKINEKD